MRGGRDDDMEDELPLRMFSKDTFMTSGAYSRMNEEESVQTCTILVITI